MIWWFLGVLGIMVLVGSISYRNGYLDCMRKVEYEKQRMEATRMWTETMAHHMGGQNEKSEG